MKSNITEFNKRQCSLEPFIDVRVDQQCSERETTVIGTRSTLQVIKITSGLVVSQVSGLAGLLGLSCQS